jgi:hypothetical protein
VLPHPAACPCCSHPAFFLRSQYIILAGFAFIFVLVFCTVDQFNAKFHVGLLITDLILYVHASSKFVLEYERKGWAYDPLPAVKSAVLVLSAGAGALCALANAADVVAMGWSVGGVTIWSQAEMVWRMNVVKGL